MSKQALQALSKSHPNMERLIKAVGPYSLQPKPLASPFRALMQSIVFQQLSGKAASTIHGRLIDLFPSRRQVTAKQLSKLSDEKIRSAGISRQKLLAIRDLAQKCEEGLVPGWAKLKRMSDDEIIEHLTQVRGIGTWTVQMMLMFDLGRPDVLPIDDLGVRKGFQLAYRKKEMPKPKALLGFGEAWRPYRSIASWYLWRANDLDPNILRKPPRSK